jgi:hypothetical protein
MNRSQRPSGGGAAAASRSSTLIRCAHPSGCLRQSICAVLRFRSRAKRDALGPARPSEVRRGSPDTHHRTDNFAQPVTIPVPGKGLRPCSRNTENTSPPGLTLLNQLKSSYSRIQNSLMHTFPGAGLPQSDHCTHHGSTPVALPPGKTENPAGNSPFYDASRCRRWVSLPHLLRKFS